MSKTGKCYFSQIVSPSTTHSIQHPMSKCFYLFKGNWIHCLDELAGIIQLGRKQSFVIWEPRNKTKKYNLLILYGGALPEDYCLNKNIWKLDEQIFAEYYQEKMGLFRIHVYDQPAKTG